MPNLHEYVQQTQRFLREQRQEFINPEDIVSYVNRARREIVLRTQCIRVLTPSSAQVISATVTAGGTGYSNAPTLTITSPDFPNGIAPNPSGLQATASAIVQGGIITAIDIDNGGSGYFQPVIAITDATGSGATADLTVGPFNKIVEGQEVYKFSDIDLSANPGCRAVYYVRSFAVIYANYRYVLPIYAFSEYQAKVRQFPFQYTFVPGYGAQFGQGTNGSFYVYPIPSQEYQVEWDCQCLPDDLVNQYSFEAIPEPWTDVIPHFAAYMSFMELQNYNAARFHLDLYEKFALSYSNYARIGRTVNPYGRY